MGYHNNEIDEGRLVAFLQDAVQRVKTEEDPLVLNQYKKLFKKNVPFTLRMYVAALLAKNASQGFRGRRDRRNEHFRANENAPRRQFNSEENTEERARRRTVIDEALAATIFISAGRNRRVFPRDLIHLICSGAGLERDRIGDIRVLDNYSFVQLFAEDSEKVITALNGTTYRGRPLQVSYSRKKDELEMEGASQNDSFENQTYSDEEAGLNTEAIPENVSSGYVGD